MTQKRYSFKIKIDDFAYEAINQVSQKENLVFFGTKFYNNNLVPTHASLAVSAKFKSPTATKFSNNIIDNNLQKIADLKIEIDKKISDADNQGEVYVPKIYNFSNLYSGTNLQQFVDWKYYAGTNEIKTEIDPLQCALSSSSFSVAGYELYSLTARATVTIFDLLENHYVSGNELLYKLSNFSPFAASLDNNNEEVALLALDGQLMIPSAVNATINIVRDCTLGESLGSSYLYDQQVPVLGNFDYMQAFLDN